jgi:hypothetical protein
MAIKKKLDITSYKKLMFLNGGLPLIFLEAEDFRWWTTLSVYYV